VHGSDVKCTQKLWSENLNVRNHVYYLDVDGTIILDKRKVVH